MQPRPYQAEALDAYFDGLGEQRAGLVVHATGLGKSILFAHAAKRWDGPVMVLAHRETLIEQAAEHLRNVCGETVRMDYAMHFERKRIARVVCSTMQSMSRKKRLNAYDPERNWLIVIDEAHRSRSQSYQAIWGHFRTNPASALLGLTATPDRGDGQPIVGPMFDFVAHEFNLDAAIPEGWLCPIEPRAIVVGELTEADLIVRAGDLAEDQLGAILRQKKPVLQVSTVVHEKCGHEPTVIFCAGVQHAIEMAKALNDRQEGLARVVSSWDEHKPNNDLVMADFKAGKFPYLVNADMLIEGYDNPAIRHVVRARPSKVRARAAQEIGRGTRTLPGVIMGIDDAAGRRTAIAASQKPVCFCWDFVGDGHSMVHSADVLLPKDLDEDVKGKFRKIVEQGNTADTIEKIKLAKALVALEKEENERLAAIERAKVTARKVEYSERKMSLYGEVSTDGIGKLDVGKVGDATDKQKRYLRHLGIAREKAEACSKRQAGVLIDRILKSRGKQLA